MNYEQLYKECLFHLRCVSGSRNSFTGETFQAIHDAGIRLERSEVVEKLHNDAYQFLKIHDKA